MEYVLSFKYKIPGRGAGVCDPLRMDETHTGVIDFNAEDVERARGYAREWLKKKLLRHGRDVVEVQIWAPVVDEDGKTFFEGTAE